MTQKFSKGPKKPFKIAQIYPEINNLMIFEQYVHIFNCFFDDLYHFFGYVIGDFFTTGNQSIYFFCLFSSPLYFMI